MDPRLVIVIRVGIAIGVALLSLFLGKIIIQNPDSIPLP